MKWLLIVAAAIAIAGILHPVSAKSVDKAHRSHRKKASSVKPTKTPKSLVEQFRGLPADDFAFIEALDKQFQLHGEKVKIKVERDNTTTTQAPTGGKNSKRTIDGSLSLGYHHNPHHPQHQQFYFSKPRYEIIPFHQDHIAPVRHTYNRPEGQTTVEITQSQGYEIKEVQDDYPQSSYGGNYVRFPGHAAALHAPQPQPTHEEVPVIVLKVPGPSKYASHLRTLLQQYLEIRAAQVIRELEQQEHVAAQLHAEQFQQHQQQLRNHAQQQYRQQQQYQQQQAHFIRAHPVQQGLQTHVQYATPASLINEQHPYHQYHNGHSGTTAQTLIESDAGHHGHAVYGNPTAPAPEENPVDYLQGEYQPQAGHTVYEDHRTQYVQNQPQHAEAEQEYYQQEQEQDSYQQHQQLDNMYRQQEQQHLQGHIMYVTAATPHQQQEEQQQAYDYPESAHDQGHEEPIHNPHASAAGEQIEIHHHGSDNGGGAHLETPENYPDEKHTRVVFTKNLSNRPQQIHHQHHTQMVLVATKEPPPPPADRFRGPIYLPTPVPQDEDYAQHDHDQHLHEQQQQQQLQHEEHHHIHQQQQQLEYDPQAMATPGPFITITQKRKLSRVPFNYHAHGRVSTPPPRKRETPYTEDEFNKFNKLVNRLKKKPQQPTMVMERTKKSLSEQQDPQKEDKQ